MSIDVEGLKSSVDLAALVGHYTPIKKRGGEFVARCVAHSPDDNPSMFVIPRKGFVHCFTCDFSADAVGFLQHVEGIDFKEACRRLGANNWEPKFAPAEKRAPRPDRITSKPPPDAPTPTMKTRELGEPSRIWPYRDADGGIIGYVARYETPEGKQIRCWSWGARAGAEPGWGCGHFTGRRPLYGLDLLAARPESPALVVEGEKAADAARVLLPSYVVVTWPAGSNSWDKAEWEPLRGRRMLLWPDNDAPGLKCMAGLAALLRDGIACPEIKIIDPNRMPDGFDAADWSGTGEELIAWAKPRARIFHPAPAQQDPAPQAIDSPPSVDASAPLAEPAGAGPSEEPPPFEFPPGTTAEPPRAARKRSRPRLATVDGNTALALDEDEAQLPVSMSEDALADHFADAHAEKWRYVAQWGRWFKWCGDVWQEDMTEEVYDLARQLCRAATYWQEAAGLTPDQKKKISRRATAGSVRDNARADRRIAAVVDQWDTDPLLLGVPGGVVDLRTGQMLDGSPEQYITKKCAVAPAAGPHPLFDMVVDRASAGDASMRDYLMRWFGYMLTGDVREECFLFLHGPGGSGKGTLVKVIGDILGDYAKTISMEALTESKAQRHPQELAKLARARFVYSSETEEGRRWNESLIKWLTGRDKVTAHFMRENDFEFYPQFKLLIYGNHIPHLKSVGQEMRRRVHLVEYAGSLSDEERDTTLKDRLVAEYPAILHTMIQGCIQWQDCGLGKPERVTNATEQYLESEDTVGVWLADNIERDIAAREPSGDVYRDFKRWCEAAGEFCVSQKRFTQDMKQRGFDTDRDAGKRYLSGLRIKNRPSAPPGYSPGYDVG